MKLIIQNSRIAATATDDYTGPDEYITAPGDFDAGRMGEYVYADGAVIAPALDQTELAWGRIKTERDRCKYLGVKVGQHWFHSDDPSRIQQLALAMMGAAIPPGLQWKTLTLTPPPVFVEMTPSLAQSIFQATAASDAAIFAAAEAHRLTMEASSSPESYDAGGGWPASIEDGAT